MVCEGGAAGARNEVEEGLDFFHDARGGWGVDLEDEVASSPAFIMGDLCVAFLCGFGVVGRIVVRFQSVAELLVDPFFDGGDKGLEFGDGFGFCERLLERL
jgi:hypothetical protein